MPHSVNRLQGEAGGTRSRRWPDAHGMTCLTVMTLDFARRAFFRESTVSGCAAILPWRGAVHQDLELRPCALGVDRGVAGGIVGTRGG